MDPLELRLKNAAKQGTKAVHGPVYPVMGYQETVRQAMRPSRTTRRLLESRSAAAAALRRGYWFNAGGESSAEMRHQRGRLGRGDDRAIPTSAARAPRRPTSPPSFSVSITARSRC